MDLFIKRDDLSGLELSGNKVRKLEFLVADALEKGADALLSIGGIQTNHARAVAAAARAAGLECHLILRTRKSETGKDPGFAGNLLIERLLGAHIHLVSKEEYAAAGDGGFPLLQELAERLRKDGEIKSPYLIPLGGSNALGAWGYLEASREIMEQAPEAIRRGSEEVKRRRRGGGEETAAVVAFATGSAGTAAGLALGGDGGRASLTSSRSLRAALAPLLASPWPSPGRLPDSVAVTASATTPGTFTPRSRSTSTSSGAEAELKEEEASSASAPETSSPSCRPRAPGTPSPAPKSCNS